MAFVQKEIAIDQVRPALRAAGEALREEGMEAASEALLTLVQSHLVELNATRPNKGGFPRQNWYAGSARGATASSTADSADVTIAQRGFALRYFGGTVTPGKNLSEKTLRPTKALTVPASAEAYGHRAGEFPDLEFRRAKKGAKPNVVGYLVRSGGKSASGALMYVLLSQATIPEDRTLLPTDEELSTAAIDALRAVFNDSTP